MYTDDKTALYLAALLKERHIRHIVVCPGSANSPFSAAVQEYKDFICYSVSDERSAGYLACGLAQTINEPVALTCTGATAFRNFVPSLTEAYYRRLPIVVLAWQKWETNTSLGPQHTDTSVNQNDISRYSVELPMVFNDFQKNLLCEYVNAALCSLEIKGGPVLLFPHPRFPLSFHTPELPNDIWVTEIFKQDFAKLAPDMLKRRSAVFIGSHTPFPEATLHALSVFAGKFNIPVYVDQTSNYYGANKVLTPRAINMRPFKENPELVIDMGGITGDYNASPIFARAAIWRLAPDGEFQARYNKPVEKLLVVGEEEFFRGIASYSGPITVDSGGAAIAELCASLVIPPLPFAAAYIAQQVARRLPQGSLLHLGILNSLRNFNFFPLPHGTEVFCNVGGFGIDGALSTFCGQCLANVERPCFGVVGDLAFFYDMNILGNRHLPPNFRLILVNNGNGQEMSIIPELGGALGEVVKPFICAAGHFRGGAEGWIKSNGIEYRAARSCTEFDAALPEFFNMGVKKPIILEAFTESGNENNSLKILWMSNEK